jgi:hypothetical protein
LGTGEALLAPDFFAARQGKVFNVARTGGEKL